MNPDNFLTDIKILRDKNFSIEYIEKKLKNHLDRPKNDDCYKAAIKIIYNNR